MTAISVIGHRTWRALAARRPTIKAAWMPAMAVAMGHTTASERATDHFCAKNKQALFQSSAETYVFIVEALYPSDQAQARQYLRLDAQSNIELFYDVVHSQWDASPSP